VGDGDVGEPVEYSVVAGEFREQPHASEEEIDVEAFRGGFAGEGEGDEAKDAEEGGTGADPDDFRQSERAHEHEKNAECGDGPDEGVGEQRVLLLWVRGENAYVFSKCNAGSEC